MDHLITRGSNPCQEWIPNVSHIKTDHDGAWDHDTESWQDNIAKPVQQGGLNVQMEYISKDRHGQNPAERHIGIVEVALKSILMQAHKARGRVLAGVIPSSNEYRSLIYMRPEEP